MPPSRSSSLLPNTPTKPSPPPSTAPPTGTPDPRTTPTTPSTGAPAPPTRGLQPARKPAAAAAPPAPADPQPWLWRCHACLVVYRLSTTRRCLECGHEFCVGGAAEPSAKRRRRTSRGGPCRAEFDYSGWARHGAWRRGVGAGAAVGEGAAAAAEEASGRYKQHKDALFVRRRHSCWLHCDFPSECRHVIYNAQKAGRPILAAAGGAEKPASPTAGDEEPRALSPLQEEEEEEEEEEDGGEHVTSPTLEVSPVTPVSEGVSSSSSESEDVGFGGDVYHTHSPAEATSPAGEPQLGFPAPSPTQLEFQFQIRPDDTPAAPSEVPTDSDSDSEDEDTESTHAPSRRAEPERERESRSKVAQPTGFQSFEPFGSFDGSTSDPATDPAGNSTATRKRKKPLSDPDAAVAGEQGAWHGGEDRPVEQLVRDGDGAYRGVYNEVGLWVEHQRQERRTHPFVSRPWRGPANPTDSRSDNVEEWESWSSSSTGSSVTISKASTEASSTEAVADDGDESFFSQTKVEVELDEDEVADDDDEEKDKDEDEMDLCPTTSSWKCSVDADKRHLMALLRVRNAYMMRVER